MTKTKLLSNVSLSTAQALINQLSGILVFLVISKHLTKENLGQLNWSVALLTVVFSVLGFGLEPVAVRKAATGSDLKLLLRNYLFHVCITGALLMVIVFVLANTLPVTKQAASFFIGIAASQCLGFFAVPFKQVANGLEKFKPFFFMSCAGNLVRMVLLISSLLFTDISFLLVIEIYFVAAALELSVCLYLCKFFLKLPVIPGFNKKEYAVFIREALPQLGISVFNIAVQRMDWVLLGLLSTSVMVSEYSFANRFFELALLPLLIASPLIFPYLSKIFQKDADRDEAGISKYLQTLIRVEILVSVFVAMIITVCWTPAIDFLTHQKYGHSAQSLIGILSIAMPLVYLNNIFWSVLFSQEKMRLLLFIFMYTFLTNIIADLILIPFFQSKGTAIGFVTALLVQSILYIRNIEIAAVKKSLLHLFPVAAFALISGWMVCEISDSLFVRLPLACISYLLLLYLFGYFKIKNFRLFKQHISTQKIIHAAS